MTTSQKLEKCHEYLYRLWLCVIISDKLRAGDPLTHCMCYRSMECLR